MEAARKQLLGVRAGLMIMLSLVLLSGNLFAQSRYRVSHKTQGYSLIAQGSVLLPSNQYPLGLAAEIINGYQVNPQFTVGLGVGVNAYQENLFIPVFLDARYHFMKGNTPFLCADAGYSLAFDGIQGGPLGHGGVGYKVYFSNTLALNVMAGYKVQRFRVVNTGQAGNYNQNRQISSFAGTIGISF